MSKANPRYRRKNAALPPPTGNVMLVKIIGELELQQTVSTFYFMDDGTKADVTPEYLATGLVACVEGPLGLGSFFTSCCSMDWLFKRATCDSPTSPTVTGAERLYTAQGVAPAGHLPTTVAATIQRRSIVKSQCGRGHLQVPAVPKIWVNASVVSNTTEYDALANAMLATFNVSSRLWTPVIWSAHGSWHAPTPGAAPLVTCKLFPTTGTVRRRKLGKGK